MIFLEPSYLAVFTPNALELAVTVGIRPMSRADAGNIETQAADLTGSFELVES